MGIEAIQYEVLYKENSSKIFSIENYLAAVFRFLSHSIVLCLWNFTMLNFINNEADNETNQTENNPAHTNV